MVNMETLLKLQQSAVGRKPLGTSEAGFTNSREHVPPGDKTRDCQFHVIPPDVPKEVTLIVDRSGHIIV